MTVWVLHCWALDVPEGSRVWTYDKLEDAIEAALAYTEADRFLHPQHRSLYSICEADANQLGR